MFHLTRLGEARYQSRTPAPSTHYKEALTRGWAVPRVHSQVFGA